MFSFISKWFDKLNRPQGQLPQAPKGFQSRKKSIFLNRYAGLVYFIAVWHAFGYVIVSGAKRKAESEGLEIHQYMSPGQRVKRIEIGKNFEIKTSES